MSVRGQAAFWTAGGLAALGGWKAQNCRPFSMSISLAATAFLPSRGSAAPPAIHFSKSATTSSDSLDLGGILSVASVCLIAFRSRLRRTSPETMAGPVSPPLRMPSRVSRSRFPFSFLDSSEWHW